MFDDHSFGTSMEVPIRIPANCSQCGFDGTSICIPTANSNQLDVLVVDATTYEVIGTIETRRQQRRRRRRRPVVVDSTYSVLQRFDID